MTSLLTQIGLGPSSSLHTSGFLIWNRWYAYGVLSSRTIKQYHCVDHNRAPRQDISEHCEKAVKEGRLSERALDRIKRTQAASENSVEGYTLFVASGIFHLLRHFEAICQTILRCIVLFAMVAKLPNETINMSCASYTLARLVHGPAYILIESDQLALIRSVARWWCNVSCLTLLWKGGNALLARAQFAA